MLKRIVLPLTIVATLFGSAGVAGAATTRPSATGHIHRSNHTRLRNWLAAHRSELRTEVLAISAQTIGVSSQDLVSELRTGKSIADVAGEHNVGAQAVIDALTSAADAKVNQAVTNNKLTSAQATRIEAKLPPRLAELVNHRFGVKTARPLQAAG